MNSLDLVDDAKRVGTWTVALVDKGDAGYVVPLHLTVDGDGLRLHAADRAQHEDSTVQHAQCSLNLQREWWWWWWWCSSC